MGKAKRKFNWKARRVVSDDTPKEPIEVPEVELEKPVHGTIDSSNALVLPAKKEKAKKTDDDLSKKVKRLSKKRRKQLEKVIEHRKKKERVSSLVEGAADAYTRAGLVHAQCACTCVHFWTVNSVLA